MSGSTITAEEAPACAVLFTLHGQLCALPVAPVRDILDRYTLTPVPLAPPEITGHLNLRGRVVTAIDLRRLLPSAGAVTPSDGAARERAIVVERANTLYAFLVDDVREVLELPAARREAAPASLAAGWSVFTACIYRLDDALVACLDPDRLLDSATAAS